MMTVPLHSTLELLSGVKRTTNNSSYFVRAAQIDVLYACLKTLMEI